jgi:hypothetical protein
MTREELREKIAKTLFNRKWPEYIWEKESKSQQSYWLNEVDQILALLDKEGWKSPEDCQGEFMVGFDAWIREQNKRGQP